MKIIVALCVLALSAIHGVLAMQRCPSTDLVLGSGREASPLAVNAHAAAPGVTPGTGGLVLIPNPTLTDGASARSTAEVATFAYGSPKEYSFSNAVGAGMWSVTKQAGRVFLTVKVQFAYAVPMDDLVFGSEFEAPFEIATGMKRAVDAAASACKRVMGSGAVIDITSDTPSALTPFVNVVTRVHVSKEAPAGTGLAVAHDMSLSDGSGKSLSFYRRPSNRVGKSFTPGVWWTFVYEEKNKLEQYQAWWAKWINAQSVLADQPLQWTIKDKARGEYLVSLDLWTAAVAKGYQARYCSA